MAAEMNHGGRLIVEFLFLFLLACAWLYFYLCMLAVVSFRVELGYVLLYRQPCTSSTRRSEHGRCENKSEPAHCYRLRRARVVQWVRREISRSFRCSHASHT